MLNYPPHSLSNQLKLKKQTRNSSKQSLCSGFTVVELLVAIVATGIIIPAVAMALTNITAINYQARDAALASMTAQNKAETLRSIGYNSIAAGTVDFSAELSPTIGTPKSATYTVTNNTPSTGIKQIDISISYTEYNVTKSTAFRTYISELGVGQ